MNADGKNQELAAQLAAAVANPDLEVFVVDPKAPGSRDWTPNVDEESDAG